MNNDLYVAQGRKARIDGIDRDRCPYHRATRQAGLWWMGWDQANLSLAQRAASDAGQPRDFMPYLKPGTAPGAVLKQVKAATAPVRRETPEGWNGAQLVDLIHANAAVGNVSGRMGRIAEALGRGGADVEAALTALQLHPWRESRHHWGAAAVVDLLQRCERGQGNNEIAAAMSRTLDAVKGKLRELREAGVTIARPRAVLQMRASGDVHPWTEEQEAEVVRRWMEGETAEAIGAAIGRTRKSVEWRVVELRNRGIPLPDRRKVKIPNRTAHAAAE